MKDKLTLKEKVLIKLFMLLTTVLCGGDYSIKEVVSKAVEDIKKTLNED
jgi:hypothetical protein